MEFIDSPVGKIRVPDELKHAPFTDQTIFYWSDGGMGVYYWRAFEDLDGKLYTEDDGAVGEVVAHIFMTEEHFANVPRTIDAFLEMRRDAGPKSGDTA